MCPSLLGDRVLISEGNLRFMASCGANAEGARLLAGRNTIVEFFSRDSCDIDGLEGGCVSPRDRFSLIGHEGMELMNPLTRAEVIGVLGGVGALGRVIDVGAGRGDLARIVVELGGECVAIDRSEAACAIARERGRGLAIEVVCGDAREEIARARGRFDLGCALGAVHAFGDRAPGWGAAKAALGAIASRVLLADLVATGADAAREFEVARIEELGELGAPALVLDAARVRDYERRWSESLARWLGEHADDPRADWARERVAWTDAPALRAARAELAFAVFVL